ncbi:MAG: hypothetical protein K9G62_02330 [Alphaproteobacteria bacterium]|nr:hypothetical protein [Alphaproteobacteria bacterium]
MMRHVCDKMDPVHVNAAVDKFYNNLPELWAKGFFKSIGHGADAQEKNLLNIIGAHINRRPDTSIAFALRKNIYGFETAEISSHMNGTMTSAHKREMDQWACKAISRYSLDGFGKGRTYEQIRDDLAKEINKWGERADISAAEVLDYAMANAPALLQTDYFFSMQNEDRSRRALGMKGVDQKRQGIAPPADPYKLIPVV